MQCESRAPAEPGRFAKPHAGVKREALLRAVLQAQGDGGTVGRDIPLPQHPLTGGIYHQPGRKSVRPAHHQENRQGVGRGRDGVTAVGLRQHLLESAQGVAIIGQYVAGFTGPQVEGKPGECHVTVAPYHAPQQVFKGEAERQTASGLSNDADIKAQADTFNGGPGPSGTIR